MQRFVAAFLCDGEAQIMYMQMRHKVAFCANQQMVFLNVILFVVTVDSFLMNDQRMAPRLWNVKIRHRVVYGAN